MLFKNAVLEMKSVSNIRAQRKMMEQKTDRAGLIKLIIQIPLKCKHKYDHYFSFVFGC